MSRLKSVRKTIKLDERTDLLAHELKKKLGISYSAVIRMLCTRTLNEIVDDEGQIQLPKIKKRQNL